jgi:hypothetical protein
MKEDANLCQHKTGSLKPSFVNSFSEILNENDFVMRCSSIISKKLSE